MMDCDWVRFVQEPERQSELFEGSGVKLVDDGLRR
jgi:hypothetical protein